MDLSTGENLIVKERLVKDQPGWFLTLIGILLASLIGFVLRAYFSPHFVKNKILLAAKNINAQVITHIDSAKLVLHDGWWPELAVVLEQVTLESNYTCWMSPLIQIDKMKLPLSLSALILRGQVEVKNIESSFVTLKFRSEKGPETQCRAGAAETLNGMGAVVLPSSKILHPHQEAVKGIEYFSIENLKVIYLPKSELELNLENIQVQVLSEFPRQAILRAKWRAFGNQRYGDYLFKSQLHFEFDESKNEMLRGTMQGQWREGTVNFKISHHKAIQTTHLDWEVKQVPMQQIMEMLNKNDITKLKFNFKNFWLTTQGKIDFESSQLARVQFQKLVFAGDLGQARAEAFNVSSVKPLKFDRLQMNLENINLDILKDVLGPKQDFKFIYNMGAITGEGQIVDRRNVSWQGTNNNLQFIFSNRGRRELQTLEQVKIKADLKDNLWRIEMAEAQLNEGEFDGLVRVEADRHFKKIKINMNIKKMRLSPAVIKLMTQEGDLSPLNVNLDWSFEEAKLKELKGYIQLEKAIVDQFEARNIGFRVGLHEELHEKKVTLHSKVESVSFARNNRVVQSLTPVLNEIGEEEQIVMKNVEGDFVVGAQSLEWKKLKFTSQQHYLQLQGEWDMTGRLSGQVQSQGPQKKKIWKLEGFRDQPQLTVIQ